MVTKINNDELKVQLENERQNLKTKQIQIAAKEERIKALQKKMDSSA